jgi:outer membrane receptor protein involved in Fe transport
MNKRSIVFPICLLAIFLITGFAYAGTTGKVAGLVIDKATGEGLAGVNVYFNDTSLGAATDLDGYYQIINVPPGSYSLTVSIIGYGTVTVEGVKIQVDKTTTQNITLVQETLETEAVVVVADRPLVEHDRTNSAAYIDAETIKLLPVQDVKDVIQLQAGVVTGADGQLHIRGGRSREISYLVDGVSVTNVFSQSGGSNVAIENSFVEELQVITGTFNAEYGSAQSGIINVVTKRPNADFKAEVDFFVGDYLSGNTERFIGISDFDPVGERDIQVTFSGPLLTDKLGYFISARDYKRDGYLFGERRYNQSDGWIIDAYRHWYTERYAGQITEEGRIAIPDSLTTGDGAAVPMAESEKITFVGKLTYSPIPDLGLNYSLFAANSEGQGYRDSWRYAPDGRVKSFGYSHHHFLAFRHSLTNNIFYNLRVSYQYNHDESYLYKDIDIADYPGDAGYLPLGASDDQTGFVQGDNQWDRGFTERQVVMTNGDFNWQVDRFNLIKLGFEASKHNIQYHNQPLVETVQWQSKKYTTAISGKGLEFNEYMDAMTAYWNTWSDLNGVPKLRLADETDGDYVDYTRQPLEFAAYIQDKIELDEMIINAGLRLDFFDPSAYTLINKRAISNELGDPENLQKSTIKTQLSPRLGFSFPISANGAFHVSYGHFFQMPSFEKLYTRPVDENLTSLLLEDALLGDPDLKPERTIAYEVGLQQQVSAAFSVDLTLFYKDIRDQLGVEAVRTPDVIGYQRYINRDYGNVKGFTLASRMRSGLFSGTIDYTYTDAKGSASDPDFLQLIEVATRLGGESVQFPERQILPLDWDQTHTINLTLNVVQPRNWAASLIGSWGSGLPYSPTSVEQLQLPDREFKNSARKPIRYNLDLRASKDFILADIDFSIFLRIYNLLDNLNEEEVYQVTGKATENARLPVDEQVQLEFLERGGQFTMAEWDNRPHWFSEPRRIQLGLSVRF